MVGIDRETGKAIEGWPHVLQSIKVILTTPIGSRVMRREFGSFLYDLIGRPMTSENILAVYAATALAIAQWEPRFSLTGCEIDLGSSGGLLGLTIHGTYEGDQVSGQVSLTP